MRSAEIIYMYDTTNLDQRADEILQAVLDNNPAHLFIIAWSKDGSLPTYHSTTSDFPTVLMRLREFEHKFFNGDFSGERS